MDAFLGTWTRDGQETRPLFIRLHEKLSRLPGAVLTFKKRPGVSYSLRAALPQQAETDRPLFVLVDVIDDDPDNRWLSVCFYADTVSDPAEEGNLVPNGILGVDATCFDLALGDGDKLDYVEARIDEVYEQVRGNTA
jgi:hypothetical protein